MNMMTQQRDDNVRVREELTLLRQDNVTLRSEMEANVRRMTRRQSFMIPLASPTTPLSSPPKVSSMTHSAFRHLRTPASDPLVNNDAKEGDVESDDNENDRMVDSVEDEEAKVHPKALSRQRKAGVDEEKEAAKLAKVMSKRAPPTPFFGEKESEREGVEQWVIDANGYLNSQFGQLAHEYPRERLQLVQSYIKGAAASWITAALQTDPLQTWESMQGPFIEFIRGGRESRSLWMEKMKNLVYGKGKCKDLLGLEQEFEQLRIKLYPTSSTDAAMNEVVGREYADAIRRGDIILYKEMLRILGGKEKISLSEWKNAAVSALKICTLTATSQRHRDGGSAGQQPQRWGQGHKYGHMAVHEMNTEGDSEEQTEKSEAHPVVNVQQMQGKQILKSKSASGPRLLTDEQNQIVWKEGRCFQCYKKGHRIGDDVCKEKGKPRRKPAEGELNL